MNDEDDELEIDVFPEDSRTWYAKMIDKYMEEVGVDELRRFLCLDMATMYSPPDAVATNAAAFERFLKGRGPRAVE